MNIREAVARAIVAKQMEQHNVRGTSLEEVDAAITAFLDAAAKQGWRMARDEATEEMVQAGWEGRYKAQTALSNQGIYSAMLAVAPKFEWDGK